MTTLKEIAKELAAVRGKVRRREERRFEIAVEIRHLQDQEHFLLRQRYELKRAAKAPTGAEKEV